MNPPRQGAVRRFRTNPPLHLLAVTTAFVVFLAMLVVPWAAKPAAVDAQEDMKIPGPDFPVGPTNWDILVNVPTQRTFSSGTHVIENVRYQMGLVITGSSTRVTLRNCHVIHPNSFWTILVENGAHLTMEDCQIGDNTTPAGERGVGVNNVTLRRVKIVGHEDGIKAGSNSLYEQVWVEDLRAPSRRDDPHFDGIQDDGGHSNWVLRYSRVEPEPVPGGRLTTSAVLIKSDLGSINNVLLENNIFDNGAYTIHVSKGNNYPIPSNITIRNNGFGRDYGWGILNETGTGVLWQNNYWVNTGQCISKSGTVISGTCGPTASTTTTTQSPPTTTTPTTTTTLPPGGTTFTFDYANRAALVGAGWGFLAKTPEGAQRNTEASGLTYSASGLGVQAGVGDLWMAQNDTLNSIFRDLPVDWTSVEVDLRFAPLANYQNAGIVLYVNDDNYVQIYREYSGGHEVGLVSETNGVPTEVDLATTATDLRLRLSRSGSVITGAISTNGGSTWTTVGTVTRSLASPRLALITGSNKSGGTPPTATYRSVTVRTGSEPPPTTTLPPTTTTTTQPPTTTTTQPPTTTTTTTTTTQPPTTTTTTQPPTTTTTTQPPTTTTTTTTTQPPTTTTTQPPTGGRCSPPDPSPTVVIGTVDSGVKNRVVKDGCTIDDLIPDELANVSRSQYRGAVQQAIKTLRTDRAITVAEERPISQAFDTYLRVGFEPLPAGVGYLAGTEPAGTEVATSPVLGPPAPPEVFGPSLSLWSPWSRVTVDVGVSGWAR